MTIEEFYDEVIRPLAASERFRLARLILSEISPQSVVDIRDSPTEEAPRENSANSEGLFLAEFPEEDDLVLLDVDETEELTHPAQGLKTLAVLEETDAPRHGRLKSDPDKTEKDL